MLTTLKRFACGARLDSARSFVGHALCHGFTHDDGLCLLNKLSGIFCRWAMENCADFIWLGAGVAVVK
jgi:hypothetical protein